VAAAKPLNRWQPRTLEPVTAQAQQRYLA